MKRLKRQALLVAAIANIVFASAAGAMAGDSVQEAIRAAESQLGARVGVAIHDTGSDRSWLHRADERFPMASTAKVPVCATLLHGGAAAAARSITLRPTDLQSYSPVTKRLVGESLPASELCAITLRTSDNTAVNKVLEVLGGPSSVTAFLREIGDAITRLDRDEPTLNEGKPGDPRDTTTPRAMAATLEELILGSALSPHARGQMQAWMESNEVAGSLLRAVIPADWRIADRSGAGGHGTRGIVAIMWPPDREPVVAAIYLTGTEASMEARDAAIRTIGAALAAELRK
jgi:beta-lactamase class A